MEVLYWSFLDLTFCKDLSWLQLDWKLFGCIGFRFEQVLVVDGLEKVLIEWFSG